nr:hypothetical protein [Tanacetum cinerariifolium]
MEWANKFKGDDIIAEYNKIKSAVECSTTSQGVKRSGPTLEPGSPKKMMSTAGPSLGSTPADEVPADTGVSTAASVPADQRVSSDKSAPADTRIPTGKAVLTKAVSLNPIDPTLLQVDVAQLVPKLRKNRTAHSDYIRNTQEEAATL